MTAREEIVAEVAEQFRAVKDAEIADRYDSAKPRSKRAPFEVFEQHLARMMAEAAVALCFARSAEIVTEPVAEWEAEQAGWERAFGADCAHPYDELIDELKRAAERLRALAQGSHPAHTTQPIASATPTQSPASEARRSDGDREG